jgi:hypothetical protein
MGYRVVAGLAIAIAKVSNGYPKNSMSAPIADELRSVLALPWTTTVSPSLPRSKSSIRKEERLTIDANIGRPAQSELGILVDVVIGNVLHEHHDSSRTRFSLRVTPKSLECRKPGVTSLPLHSRGL